MNIKPTENRITGKWEFTNGKMIADENCSRIQLLTKELLKKVGTDESGWQTLYFNPEDESYWELSYPNSEHHGGGPPELTRIAKSDELANRYNINSEHLAYEDHRNIWRQRWLESINELTSLRLQESTWQNPPDQSPHWSFVEFMCCYFDDVLADQPYEELVKQKWVEESEYAVIKSWHTNLNEYKSPNNDDYDNSAILNCLFIHI